MAGKVIGFVFVAFLALAYCGIDDEGSMFEDAPQHMFSPNRFHRTTQHHKKQRHHIHVPKLHHVKASSRQYLNGKLGGNCLNPCGNGGLNIGGLNAGGLNVGGLNGGLNINGLNGGLNNNLEGAGQFQMNAVPAPMQCCDHLSRPNRIRTKNFHRVVVQSNRFHPNNPLHFMLPGKNIYEPSRHVYDNTPIRHVQSKYAPTFEEKGTSQVVAPQQNIFNAVQNLCQPPVFTSGCGNSVPVPATQQNMCQPPYLTGNACNPSVPTYPGDMQMNSAFGGGEQSFSAGAGGSFFPPGIAPMQPVGQPSFINPTMNNLQGGAGFPNIQGLTGGISMNPSSFSQQCLPPVTCGPETEAKEDDQPEGPVIEGKDGPMIEGKDGPMIEGKEDSPLVLPKNPFLRRYIPKLLGTIFQNPNKRHNLKHHHHHGHHAKHSSHSTQD